MKRLIALLCLVALICTGCAKSAPKETQADTTAPTTEPTTEATEPTMPEPIPPAPTFDPMEIVATMTLEERVGQIFLACCPTSGAAEDVSQYHLGGIFLFGRDFANDTPESISQKIAGYQDAADIPLIISVDEEGGVVCRISSYPQYREAPFLSPRLLYAWGGFEMVYETEAEKCQLLRSLGINVNASPICDISTDPKAFIYSRSFGQDPVTTGTFVAGVCNVMAENGISGILKHFPGYGNNTDTHEGIVVDDRPLEELESVDLVPFAMGIAGGAQAIMVSHTFINAIDPDYPATLSPKVIQYLREDMGFEGVIVTDELSMAGVSYLYGSGEAAVRAVLAGNDMICSWIYETHYNAVLAAVQSGRIPEATLNQAVARVLQWKYNMGLLAEDAI